MVGWLDAISILVEAGYTVRCQYSVSSVGVLIVFNVVGACINEDNLSIVDIKSQHIAVSVKEEK